MNESYQRTQEEIARRLRERDAGRAVARIASADKASGLPVFGEKALREFEQSSLPMRIFDLATLKFLAVNDATVSFYGYSREEFLGMSVADLRHPDEHDALESNLAEQSDYLRHHPARRHVTKSGEVMTVELLTQDVLYNGRRARLSLTMDLTGRLRMHELLWQRQEEFERLAENLPDLVARFDQSHRFVYLNSAVEKLLGKARHEMIGRTQRELGMPDNLVAKFARSLEEAFDTGESHTLEFGVLVAGGERLFEACHIPERSADGQISTVMCVAHDITDRKRAESALREGEERFALAVDNTGLGMWDWNVRTSEVWRHPRWARMLGYEPGEVRGHICMWREFCHPDDWAGAQEKLLAHMEGTAPHYAAEYRMRKKDGTWLWVVCRGKVIERDGDGAPLRMIGYIQDTSEDKQAEGALRESEERFRQLAENIRQVFWINTLPGDRIIYVSPAYEEIWGKSRESLCRNPHSWMESIHRDDLAAVQDGQARMARGNRTDVEYRIIRPDRTVRWIKDRSYSMKAGDGSPLACGIAEDITDLKLAEQEKLTHAIHQRDALVREVHHRIKNSLQGIVWLLRQKIRKHPAVAPDIEEAIGQLQSLALVYGLQETRPDGLLSLAEITDAICSSAERLVGGRVNRTLGREARRQACIGGVEAVSVAVALNELVFNALKHQPARAGRKRATVRLNEAPGAAEIRISNRGRLPRSFNFEEGRAVGYGLGLVRTLLAPPGGAITFNGGRGKVEVKVTLAPPLLAGPRKANEK